MAFDQWRVIRSRGCARNADYRHPGQRTRGSRRRNGWRRRSRVPSRQNVRFADSILVVFSPFRDAIPTTDVRRRTPVDVNSLSTVRTGSTVIFGGILTGLRKRVSQKNNRPFAFGVLEEFLGKIEVVFWSDAYEEFREYIELDAMILVRGKFQKDTELETI